jgi:hypothetical protein
MLMEDTERFRLLGKYRTPRFRSPRLGSGWLVAKRGISLSEREKRAPTGRNRHEKGRAGWRGSISCCHQSKILGFVTKR